MYKNFKIVSLALVICMLCSVLPTNVFGQKAEKVVSRNTSISKHKAEIIDEDISKREKNVKHFLKDDLTYEAFVYPEAVHYKDGDTWKDIDNSFISDKDNDQNDVLTNKSNDLKVMIAKSADANKLVTIKKDKYELAWNLEGAASVSEAVYQISKEEEKGKSKLKTTLDNLFSDVEFKNIYQGIDLKYQIRPEAVKEDIVINQKGISPEFTFNISVNNLDANLCEDNSIVFTDKKDSKTKVFEMKAPFMYDAKGEVSNNIAVSFEKDKSGYRLIMKPDFEWLNSDEREYPVTIDPYIKSESTASTIEDSTVMQAYPSTNYGNLFYMFASRNSSSDIRRSYMKFTLPQLSSADMVTEAKLFSYVNSYNTVNKVEAFQVTESWSESLITWNNQPSIDPKVIDYQNINSSGNFFAWDITRCVNSWYTIGNNYGIVLKADEDSVTSTSNMFFSSDYSTSTLRPYIGINYINTAGLESYWTYHSQQVGRAGTVYTNDFNGSVVVAHDDVVMNGNRMPVTLQHVYNSAYKDVNCGYGNGWNLNLNQTLGAQTIGGTQYYVYLDEDGTKHYFSDIGTGVFKDESGLNLTLEFDTINSTKSIVDKKDNILVFNSDGKLVSIEDSNGNTITLGYTDSKLTSITDGVDRVTTLEYYPAGNAYAGNLCTITDPSSRETTYEYSLGGNLYKIHYSDGVFSEYIYSYNRIYAVLDHTGYRMIYRYYDTQPYRLMEIEEGNSDGQLIEITYGSNQTQWETQYPENDKKRTVHQFNNYGNTTSQMDNSGNTQYFQYYDYNDRNYRNKLKLESKLQIPILNKVKDAGCYLADTDEYYWDVVSEGSSAGTGGWSGSVPKYFGVGAFYIEKNNTQGRHFLTEALNQLTNLEGIGIITGKTYTLSAFVKTKDISKSTTPKGASVFVSYVDKYEITHDLAESNYINGTLDWQKVEISFVVPSNALQICVNMGIAGETGTAYFDNVQLEEGPVSNRFNCIENPDFTYWDTNRSEENMPCYWYKSTSCSSTDIRLDPYSGYSSIKYLDSNCFRIVGESDPATAYDKRVYVDTEVPEGKAGDVYSIGCWAKADSVPNVITDKNIAISSTDRVFGLVLEFTYTDDSTETFLVPFNPNSSEWQYVCDRIQAPDDYINIKLMGCYYNNANTAYFDGFQLYKEEFGESYEYDTNGNLTEITSMNNKTTSYEYNSTNDMTSSISSGGSETKVGYDNHNPTDLITAENEKSSNTYDSYGNPLTNTVGNDNLFVNSSISYTTNGNYIDEITDPSGNKVDYNYDEGKGTLISVKYAKDTEDDDDTEEDEGTRTKYSYDSNLDRLTGVSKPFATPVPTPTGTATAVPTAYNSYSYTNSQGEETDHLTKITHNGFDYNFNYDSLWNMTSVYVGSQALITNNYEARSSKFLDSTYGNGQEIGYDYDDLDRVTAIKYNDTERYTYDYDSNGNLAYYENRTDLGSSNSSYYTQRYTYDLANRPVKTVEENSSQNNVTRYSYNDENQPDRMEENIENTNYYLGNRNYYTGYLYDKTGAEKQNYYNRYSINDGTVEYFPLSNNTRGSQGTEPTTETVEFENDESNVPVLASYEASENLLATNSSFETGSTSGWTVDTQANSGETRVVYDGADGQYCVEFYASPTPTPTATPTATVTDSIIYQDYTLDSTLTVMTKYTLSAMTKTYGRNGKDINVGLKYYKADGTSNGQTTQIWDIVYDGQWKKSERTFDVPTNTKKIRVVLGCSVEGDELVRFDAVQLEQKGFSTPYSEGGRTGTKLIYDIEPDIKPDSGTMALWFTTTGYDQRYLVSNNKTGGGNLSLYLDDSGRLVAEVKKTDGSMYKLVTSDVTISNAPYTWNYAAMRWSVSGSTLTCNLDVMNPTTGYLLTNNSDSMTATDCMDFTGASTAVGSTIDGNVNLNGHIAMFAYSEDELSSNDIESIFQAGRNSTINKQYDSLGRLTKREIATGAYAGTGNNHNYATTYSYVDKTGGASTYLLKSLTNKNKAIMYTYDANGNIETITQNIDNNDKIITYSYDTLNELTREDNQVLNRTYVYAYDTGGNITSKTEYNYTTPGSPPSNALDVYSYTYDTAWKDKLTNYNGTSLSYDAIGNLTLDGTYSYTWEEGRNLVSMSRTAYNIQFRYNADGIRTEKIVNGYPIKYHLEGDRVTYERTMYNDDIYYTYDANGSLVSMNLNGKEYFYVKNGQGDIIALIDNIGTEVVSYTYDTWGKVISVSGTQASTVGQKNPYRYRGYRYDTETGLYYLQSRYYNPDWGRFINADGIVGKIGNLLSVNMFAYCQNNPINRYDPSGFSSSFREYAEQQYYNAASTFKGEKVNYPKNGKRYLWGDLEIVKFIGSENHTYSKNETTKNSIIEQTLLFIYAFINPGGSYGIGVAKSLYKNKCIDLESIGGVYKRSYYCRTIVDPELSSITVPVPYKFYYADVYYNSPKMTDDSIEYIDVQSAGAPTLSNN